MRDLAKVRVHALANARVAASPAHFPVVLRLAGNAALVTFYPALAEDLASHGYIVVGPEAAYRTSVLVLANGAVSYRPPENDPGDLPKPQAIALATRLPRDRAGGRRAPAPSRDLKRSVCPRSESNFPPNCLKLVEFIRLHRRNTPGGTPTARGYTALLAPLAFSPAPRSFPATVWRSLTGGAAGPCCRKRVARPAPRSCYGSGRVAP